MKRPLTFDLHNAIIVYIYGILMTRITIWHYFQRNWSMFQFLTQEEFSRSMVAILKMPQYVAYPKNVAFAVIKLSVKSHNCNILCTTAVLSYRYRTFNQNTNSVQIFSDHFDWQWPLMSGNNQVINIIDSVESTMVYFKCFSIFPWMKNYWRIISLE